MRTLLFLSKVECIDLTSSAGHVFWICLVNPNAEKNETTVIYKHTITQLNAITHPENLNNLGERIKNSYALALEKIIQYLLCFDNGFWYWEWKKKKREEQILKQKFFKNTYNIFPFRKLFLFRDISTNVLLATFYEGKTSCNHLNGTQNLFFLCVLFWYVFSNYASIPIFFHLKTTKKRYRWIGLSTIWLHARIDITFVT